MSSVEHLKNLKYLSFSCKTRLIKGATSSFLDIKKKKNWLLEKFTANYNWICVFKSKKTNIFNAIYLIKLSVL